MITKLFLWGIACAAIVFGQAQTPNVGLLLPTVGQGGYAQVFTYDLTLLDNLLGGITPAPAFSLTYQASAPTAISGADIFWAKTSDGFPYVTFPSTNSYKLALNASPTFTLNDCVKYDVNGRLADNGSPCSGVNTPSFSGIVKATASSNTLSQAVPGTDYVLPANAVAVPVFSGIVKATASSPTLSHAVAGTDYLAPGGAVAVPGFSGIAKTTASSATLTQAVAGTDYLAPGSAAPPTSGTSNLLAANGSGGFTAIPGSTSGAAVVLGTSGTPGSMTLTGNTSGSAVLSSSATGGILQQGRSSGTYTAASSGAGVVDYWAYNVNNYLPIWEFAGNAAPINQALVGLMNTPTDVANIFNTGVSGYCRGTVQDAFCVGVFGLGLTAAQPAAGHAIQAWGANFAVSNCGKIFCADGDGMSSSNLTGIEVDASSFKTGGGLPATNMVGVYVTGSSTSQTATTMDGFQLQPAPVTLVPWKRGYVLGVGATNSEGVSLAAAATGNSQGSQNITMHGTNGSGVDVAGRISVDAFGDVILVPYLTGGIVLQNGSGSSMAQAGPTAFQVTPTTTNPSCTISTDIGKFWFDTTTSTTAVKVCKSVSGTVGWSVVTTTP